MSQKINTMCSCKNLKCKIHRNCKECIDHHKEHGHPHCKRPENLEAVKEMRKHISAYTKSMPDSSSFRSKINTMDTAEEVRKCLKEYFAQ